MRLAPCDLMANFGITPYQAALLAHELTRKAASDDPTKLGASLYRATVDLNPDQVDAALFAFRSPLSRGAIVADEVGLGKTIEAGLVLAQLWTERKRRILVICPTILRKQWAQELAEKFHLDSVVPDGKVYTALSKGGKSALAPEDAVVICSYNYVPSVEAEIVRRVDSLFARAGTIASRLADASAQVERASRSFLAKAFRGEP